MPLRKPQRLQAKLIKIVDISYGGEHGLNQAIDLSADALSGVKYIQEKKLIQRYFDEISQVGIVFIVVIFSRTVGVTASALMIH